MLKMAGRTAACGALFALVACGGGGGGEDADSGVAPLDSKADALREFGMAGGIAAVHDGTGAASSGGVAPKSQAGVSWRNPLPERRAAARAKAATPCPGGGESESVSGSGSYSFAFFNQVADIEFDRTVDARCIEISEFEGGTELYTYDGVIEEGHTAQRSDGSGLAYEREGSAGFPYIIQYDERRNGVSVYRETETLNGEMQFSWTADFGEFRTRYQYEFSDSQGNSVSATLGRGEQTFHVFQDQSGARVNGRYAYRSTQPGCSGGAVDVTTLEPVTFADDHINGGRVRLQSGGKSAVLTLNNDGSAVLELNGTTISVSAEEVRGSFEVADACLFDEGA